MFDSRVDFIIELIERVNAIINDMTDGQDSGCTLEELEPVIELAQQLRDDLELLVDD